MRPAVTTFLLLLFGVVQQNNLNACICSDYPIGIDSLPQADEYDFIAHVKITGDSTFEMLMGERYRHPSLLTVQIIELFKGEEVSEIVDYTATTSCGMGIAKGEEWILFGKMSDGRMGISACDRNAEYRGADEFRAWDYGFGLLVLNDLQKLYGHPVPTFYNEIRIECYSTGRIELEETYVNGKLHGDRKIWYPSGQLFSSEFYINGARDGKSEWFYPSGQLEDEDYYRMGQHFNVSRFYFDSTLTAERRRWVIDFYKTEDSLNSAYHRVQVQYERVYDDEGRMIASREYSRVGKIRNEEIFEPDRNFRTVIYYHENGVVSSIMYELNGKNYGHYQTYDKQGFPDQGWDYDENGKRAGEIIQYKK